ncbi:MAG TPA: SEC-C metal-binding domain-containing protein [Candidatus Polarisedimenticolia bacterium]|nr:SEC-C metal-binding domain-containing protein [Candidatus Polarisedimenticolia bacterium]
MAHARNEPCPCGSGEKFKRCCEQVRSSALSPGLLVLAFVVLIGTALAVGAMMNLSDQPDPTRVWSEEHGHWHTVQGEEQAPGALPGLPAQQPPGPAPPGKVWSADHGHWHDAS